MFYAQIYDIVLFMNKSKLNKPCIILLYGQPGSGKTYFSRQVSEELAIPHISSDRIRYELFEKPTFSKDENNVIMSMMIMMLDEFAKSGLSVIFDYSLNKLQDRRSLRDLARKYGMQTILVWLQADAETCFNRAKNRDRRKADDKFSAVITRDQFDAMERTMNQPHNEDALVISGKHPYQSQRAVLLRKLSEMQILSDDTLSAKVPMPELINLVSKAHAMAGRVDSHRRNVLIN